MEASSTKPARALRATLLPLALTQFIASFAGSNMNVAINTIANDLDTTVHGVQTAITLFLLCMAALMIPGSKLTDRWGRKRCLVGGLGVYGTGALIAALAPGLGVLIIGYSALQGVGSALMIPPVYILATMAFTDTASRARAFGLISGMGGIGAAAGPLIGGLITTAVSWRLSFLLPAAVVGAITLLSRGIVDPVAADPSRPFDKVGAVLSALGMSFVVFGILQAGNNNALLVVFLALGAGFMLWFFLHFRANERAGKEPLLSTGLFRNRTSNLGLRDPEHPVAAAHGDHVRRLGLPPARSRLQRDQDRGRLHGGDRRHPGLVARRRAARAELRPEDPDPDGLPGHDRRGGASARPGQGLLPRPGLHARPSAGRARPWGSC